LRHIRAGRVKQGIATMLGLAALLLSLQVGSDVVKDLIRGRKLKSAQDYYIDRTLNNLFTSRYDLASLEYSKPSDVVAKTLAPSIPVADEAFTAWQKDDDYPLYRMVPIIGQYLSEKAKSDSEKLKSLYPKPDEAKSDGYRALYRSLNDGDTKAAQKEYASLRASGVAVNDILQSVKSRAAIRVPKKDREEWMRGLNDKQRAMVDREIERGKQIESQFYSLLTDKELRTELAKIMTKAGPDNNYMARPHKGQEAKAKLLMAELKTRRKKAS
jgi:hypothetical protein